MTTQTEALKLADRLLDFASEVSADFDTTTLEKAADELRRLDFALAQPKPEPAFYSHDGYLMTPERAKFLGFPLDSILALYTTPPQRKPLTDGQIDNATRKQVDALLDHIYEYGTAAEGIDIRVRAIARRAIEAAHGIKE